MYVDVMRSVAVTWKSISSTGSHAHFAKGAFGIKKSVNKNEEDQDDSDWREIQGHVNDLLCTQSKGWPYFFSTWSSVNSSKQFLPVKNNTI